MPSDNFFSRVLSVVGADLKFRFRRPAAVITFLVAAMAVYLIIPDIRTGRTLMQIEGRRVLYNSPTVALGTGILCSMLLSIFGFYLAGNSFRRDILSRVGFIVAGTSVRNRDYITGKFIGAVIYLMAMMMTCMLSAIIMFFLRGEGDLEPWVFLSYYLWIGVPIVVFCASMTIAFESLSFLSGRLGDSLYFLVWASTLAVPIGLLENNIGSSWIAVFDVVGIAPVIDMMRERFHTSSFSLGFIDFNTRLQPVLFDGIDWSWKLVLGRLAALVGPLLLIGITPLWFHRFDPTRIKATVRHSRKGLRKLLNAMVKPATRLLAYLLLSRGKGGYRVWCRILPAEVVTTFILSPLATLAWVVIMVLSLTLPAETIRDGIVPVIMVLLVLSLSEVTTRDTAARTLGILFTVPSMQKNYLMFKFLAAWMFALSFTAIPIVRLLPLSPSSAGSLFIGSGFIAGSAVGLGLLTRDRKTFIAVFLMLLYIALNAKDVPVLDFAGFLGCATPGVQAGYLVLTLVILSVAHFSYIAKVDRM